MTGTNEADFDENPRTISVAVFAYNEERHIADCLTALRGSGLPDDSQIHVLSNGCTDRTVDIVNDFVRDHENIHQAVITVGDKANAWNHYVHEIADESVDFHIFTDGDLTVGSGAIAALTETLESHSDALAATGLPVVGRTADRWREQIKRDHQIAGNLYALRGDYLRALRQKGVRLPFGAYGDDSLVGWLTHTRLDPQNIWDHDAVAVAENANFVHNPVNLWNPTEFLYQLRRELRYAERQIQLHLLLPRLKAEGLAAMPERIDGLYEAEAVAALPRPKGLPARLFNALARRRVLNNSAG